jgi:DNA-binding XRE family transcriptional regulator
MMKKPKTEQTCDGMEIIEKRFLRNDKALRIMVDQEFQKLQIGEQIYDLRKAAKLTQEELANLIGTTGSVISRLESANYDGHSLKMLEKIAVSLGKKLEVRIVDRGKQSA